MDVLAGNKFWIVKSLLYPREYFVFRQYRNEVGEVAVKVYGKKNDLNVKVLRPVAARLSEEETALVLKCYRYNCELELEYKRTNPEIL